MQFLLAAPTLFEHFKDGIIGINRKFTNESDGSFEHASAYVHDGASMEVREFIGAYADVALFRELSTLVPQLMAAPELPMPGTKQAMHFPYLWYGVIRQSNVAIAKELIALKQHVILNDYYVKGKMPEFLLANAVAMGLRRLRQYKGMEDQELLVAKKEQIREKADQSQLVVQLLLKYGADPEIPYRRMPMGEQEDYIHYINEAIMVMVYQQRIPQMLSVWLPEALNPLILGYIDYEGELAQFAGDEWARFDYLVKQQLPSLCVTPPTPPAAPQVMQASAAVLSFSGGSKPG